MCLVSILDHDSGHLGQLDTLNLTVLATVEGCYVARAATNGSLAVSLERLLVGVDLRGAVRGC